MTGYGEEVRPATGEFERIVTQNAHWVQRYLNDHVDDGRRYRARPGRPDSDIPEGDIHIFDIDEYGGGARDDPVARLRARENGAMVTGAVSDVSNV
ncbi:MAG: hypothetical protein SVU88_04595 [Candidatus Nanohaloarchaea archaeon]|nr:hypothetical protein [Candidatus Nanohaloarchaea archaeon]